MLLIIDDNAINALVRNGMKKTIELAKHAHYTDVEIRVEGQNKRYEADWIKHLQVCEPSGRRAQDIDIAVLAEMARAPFEKTSAETTAAALGIDLPTPEEVAGKLRPDDWPGQLCHVPSSEIAEHVYKPLRDFVAAHHRWHRGLR